MDLKRNVNLKYFLPNIFSCLALLLQSGMVFGLEGDVGVLTQNPQINSNILLTRQVAVNHRRHSVRKEDGKGLL